MKTIDKNVRGLWKKPFAAFALLGLLGFGLDIMLNSSHYSEKRLGSILDPSILESPFLASSAQAASGEAKLEPHSTQTTEAKARLLFKRNESSPLSGRYWVDGLERFSRIVK